MAIGDKIIVRVGSWFYLTEINSDEVQRFIPNRVVVKMKELLRNRGYSLNDVYVDFAKNKFTQKEMLDFYVSIGYSVSGLSELSFFTDLSIENPATSMTSGDQFINTGQ